MIIKCFRFRFEKRRDGDDEICRGAQRNFMESTSHSLLSFPLFLSRDRPVQTFSFLVYPDTLSPGVSACWLIIYAYLGNNPCVFPFANVHLSTSLWEPVRDMSVFGVTYAWKHISATYIFYNLFLSLSSKNLPLSFLM